MIVGQCLILKQKVDGSFYHMDCNKYLYQYNTFVAIELQYRYKNYKPLNFKIMKTLNPQQRCNYYKENFVPVVIICCFFLMAFCLTVFYMQL